jgi:NADH:ubiquinone oxidoreductase subunit K
MLCLELMFVSTIFGFIVNSLTYTDLNEGWIVSFYLILVAASESAVGLGLLILLSRFEETIDFFEFSRIRG